MPPPRPSLRDLMPKDLPEKPDPSFRVQICAAITGLAFDPPRAVLTKWMDRIILENQKFLQEDHPFFSYLGTTYTLSSISMRPRDYPRVMPRLDKALRVEMAKWIKQQEELLEELDECNAATSSILVSASTIEDWSELLPEGLRSALRGFQNTPTAKRLTPAQLEETRVKTKGCADILRARLMANLLL